VSNWGWCRDNAKKVIIPKWITGNEASRVDVNVKAAT